MKNSEIKRLPEAFLRIVTMLLGIALLFVSCSSDDVASKEKMLDGSEHCLRMVFRGCVTSFDNTTTRVSDAVWEWQDGAIVYLQFHTYDSNTVSGYAKYSKKEDSWEVTYNGDVANVGSCEAYFFEGVTTASKHKVTLGKTHAVYADNNAKYSIADGCMVIDALLFPQTSRLRFMGISGEKIDLSGVLVCSEYDADANVLVKKSGIETMVVNTDGYTPYCYCVFEDADSPTLYINIRVNSNEMVFHKTFDSSVLKIGDSGYLTIPTEENCMGWEYFVKVNSVSFNEESVYIGKSEKVALTVTVEPSKAPQDVVWTSSDTSVATVENGVVTGKNYGTAIITATSVFDSNKKATCKVNVSDDKVFVVGGVSFKMKLVEAGSFMMGTNWLTEEERPVHRVTISQNYYIGETEVTQALWKAVTGYSPTADGDTWDKWVGLGENYPAYSISYSDVKLFINKLNSMTNQDFRMPTEAEWEFAARGGNKTKNYVFSGGNDIELVAWYKDNGGNSAHAVKMKASNELGIYDMSGNVMEWCYDWLGDYPDYPLIDPIGPSEGVNRVLRGGNTASSESVARSTCRFGEKPSSRYNAVGFRLALSSVSKE